MRKELKGKINSKWEALLKENSDSKVNPYLKYLRLEDENQGIRISCHYPEKQLGMLVEIGKAEHEPKVEFPSWNGVTFSILQIDVPIRDTWHVCLELNDSENREIFSDLCISLIEELSHSYSSEERRKSLLDFLTRWTEFFEKYRFRFLSDERQRGLFGELWWLREMISGGVNANDAVGAWKGSKKGLQDFNIEGHALEVKTTLMKEPRKVQISSEKQLDASPHKSLHLFVVSLSVSDSTGITLPLLVDSVRELLKGDYRSEINFDRLLLQAGYVSAHEPLYDTAYSVIKEELFKVSENFPRITEVPPGLGDLKYSLLLGSCTSFLKDCNSYIYQIGGHHPD